MNEIFTLFIYYGTTMETEEIKECSVYNYGFKKLIEQLDRISTL